MLGAEKCGGGATLGARESVPQEVQLAGLLQQPRQPRALHSGEQAGQGAGAAPPLLLAEVTPQLSLQCIQASS